MVLDGADVLRELADLMAPAHRATLTSLATMADVELAIPVRITVANVSVGIGSVTYREEVRGSVEALLKIGEVIDRHAAGGVVEGTSAGRIHEIVTEWRESQP